MASAAPPTGSAPGMAHVIVGKAQVEESDGRHILKVPAQDGVVRVQLAYGKVAHKQRSYELASFIRWGDARYPDPLITKGDLETVDGDEIFGAVYNTVHAMAP